MCSALLGVDNGNIIIVLVFWTTVIAMHYGHGHLHYHVLSYFTCHPIMEFVPIVDCMTQLTLNEIFQVETERGDMVANSQKYIAKS